MTTDIAPRLTAYLAQLTADERDDAQGLLLGIGSNLAVQLAVSMRPNAHDEWQDAMTRLSVAPTGELDALNTAIDDLTESPDLRSVPVALFLIVLQRATRKDYR